MEDLEADYKELKKKNKALRHHLKEEAATVQQQTTDIADLKTKESTHLAKIEQM